jgi:exodeoxyribonuclease VII small subunit
MTLERKLERLEAIVAELENEEIDLASALALFEEGVVNIRDAASALAEAETRVKKLTELAGGAFVIEDFEADG